MILFGRRFVILIQNVILVILPILMIVGNTIVKLIHSNVTSSYFRFLLPLSWAISFLYSTLMNVVMDTSNTLFVSGGLPLISRLFLPKPTLPLLQSTYVYTSEHLIIASDILLYNQPHSLTRVSTIIVPWKLIAILLNTVYVL